MNNNKKTITNIVNIMRAGVLVIGHGYIVHTYVYNK